MITGIKLFEFKISPYERMRPITLQFAETESISFASLSTTIKYSRHFSHVRVGQPSDFKTCLFALTPPPRGVHWKQSSFTRNREEPWQRDSRR